MEQNMIKFDELIKMPIQHEEKDQDRKETLIDIDLDQRNKKIDKRVNEQEEFNGEK